MRPVLCPGQAICQTCYRIVPMERLHAVTRGAQYCPCGGWLWSCDLSYEADVQVFGLLNGCAVPKHFGGKVTDEQIDGWTRETGLPIGEMQGQVYERLTPEQFVVELKQIVRDGVKSTVEYIDSPPKGSRPPPHLASFSQWYKGLSEDSKATAREILQYEAEGSLFTLLNVLDGVLDLPSQNKGEIELYYVRDGERDRLNEREGGFLYDIFNNTP